MKIQISAKNYPMSDKLSSYIEKKLGKLDCLKKKKSNHDDDHSTGKRRWLCQKRE